MRRASLGEAIRTIHAKTGRPVHLVAHSFGGLLARTLLQQWKLDGAYGDIQGLIGRVSTLGTPHSGIADKNRCLHGLALPKGQDDFDNADVFEGCGQLSCQQAGEDNLNAISAAYFGVSGVPGELIQGLSAVESLPDVDILVLMGLTAWRERNDIVDLGDALIAYEGQRLLPGDSVVDRNGGTCNDGDIDKKAWLALRDDAEEGQGHVTERLLGFEDTLTPGATNPDTNNGGYRHSDGVDGSDWGDQPPVEPLVQCQSWQSCTHDGFVQVLDWVRNGAAIIDGTERLNDTGIDWCADESQNAGISPPARPRQPPRIRAPDPRAGDHPGAPRPAPRAPRTGLPFSGR